MSYSSCKMAGGKAQKKEKDVQIRVVFHVENTAVQLKFQKAKEYDTRGSYKMLPRSVYLLRLKAILL